MKPFRSAENSTASLISVTLLYILLIVLVLLFLHQMLRDVSEGRDISGIVIIPLAVVLPIFLIGSIVYNIVKLFKERKRGHPGVRYKIRLILFFSFIATISAVPQGILSLRFIDTTLNAWFSPRLGEALEGGLTIALDYHSIQIENLKSLNSSPLLSVVLQNIEGRQSRILQHLQSIDNSIRSIQVFDTEGEEVLFDGDQDGKIPFTDVREAGVGLLPKETSEDLTILRSVAMHQGENGRYMVVISKFLPEDLDQKARSLTSALAVFKQLDRYQNLFRSVLVLFYFFFSFPILLLSILVSFLLGEEVIRPIVNLEEATKKVTEGDYSVRILSRPHDELSFLIRSFNHMVSELEYSRVKTKQTEKVSAWQEIAQRMAHEIKNPLTPIKLSAQRMLRKYYTNDGNFEQVIHNSVQSIIREVENLNTMLQEFRDFARLPLPEPETINLCALVREVVSTYSTPHPGIQFNLGDLNEEIEIRADRKQLYQVFTNLFKNAIDATDEKGEIYVRADLVTKGNLRYCRIQVQDTGYGIDPEQYDQVFNPYFTTKRDGTGLGLPIVERIIFDHNGQIWFESEKGIGTTFFIDVPVEGP